MNLSNGKVQAVVVVLVVAFLLAAAAVMVSTVSRGSQDDVLIWQHSLRAVMSLLAGSMALVGGVLLLALALSKEQATPEGVAAPLVLVLAAGFLHFQSGAAAIGAAIVVLGMITVKAINARSEIEAD